MSDEFKQWQQEYTPDRKPVEICFDRELLYRFEEAAGEVALLKESRAGMLTASPELVAAEERLEQLGEQVQKARKPFVFGSIGHRAWRDLLSKYPPEGVQRRMVTIIGIPLDMNPDTFIPVALHECCIEPGMTLEQAEWFCEKFPVSEVDRAFGAVTTCNVTGLDRPFGDTGSPLHGAKTLMPQSD
jgi:hypothetical protein